MQNLTHQSDICTQLFITKTKQKQLFNNKNYLFLSDETCGRFSGNWIKFSVMDNKDL